MSRPTTPSAGATARISDLHGVGYRPPPDTGGGLQFDAGPGEPLPLTDGLRLLVIGVDALPATGDALRRATLEAGYDGLRIEGGAAGDRVVIYRAVEQHGELGPVLVDPSHHFTGPEDLGGG